MYKWIHTVFLVLLGFIDKMYTLVSQDSTANLAFVFQENGFFYGCCVT